MKARKRVNQRIPVKKEVVEPPARRPLVAAQRVKRPPLGARLRNYAAIHFQVLVDSLGLMGRSPMSNMMTAAVIGIALALPAALHVFLDKVHSLSSAWQESAQISLFLKDHVSDEAAEAFASELRRWPEISRLDFITPVQALEDFRRHSGLGDVLAMLDENPLPGVLVVYPGLAHRSPEKAQALLEKLSDQPAVDLAQLDLEWVQRLQAIVSVADRAVAVLGGLLALAVLFVIGNTIRLAIQNRHEEIEVIKLIGGSDAFVRRPFLYSGIWYGLFGGLVAWGLVNILLLLLNGPINNLAALYGSAFSLGVVDIGTTLLLLLFGPLLGLIGAWLAAGRRLRAIEPA